MTPSAWRQWGSETAHSEQGAYTESQLVTLRAVQASLRAHHVEAEISDIVHALLEALATRPALCRGLVAAYLLGA